MNCSFNRAFKSLNTHIFENRLSLRVVTVIFKGENSSLVKKAAHTILVNSLADTPSLWHVTFDARCLRYCAATGIT